MVQYSSQIQNMKRPLPHKKYFVWKRKLKTTMQSVRKTDRCVRIERDDVFCLRNNPTISLENVSDHCTRRHTSLSAVAHRKTSAS